MLPIKFLSLNVLFCDGTNANNGGAEEVSFREMRECHLRFQLYANTAKGHVKVRTTPFRAQIGWKSRQYNWTIFREPSIFQYTIRLQKSFSPEIRENQSQNNNMTARQSRLSRECIFVRVLYETTATIEAWRESDLLYFVCMYVCVYTYGIIYTVSLNFFRERKRIGRHRHNNNKTSSRNLTPVIRYSCNSTPTPVTIFGRWHQALIEFLFLLCTPMISLTNI